MTHPKEKIWTDFLRTSHAFLAKKQVVCFNAYSQRHVVDLSRMTSLVASEKPLSLILTGLEKSNRNNVSPILTNFDLIFDNPGWCIFVTAVGNVLFDCGPFSVLVLGRDISRVAGM